MPQQTTSEFSFLLKSTKHGIGVFAMHNIKDGTYLRLFGDERLYENRIRILDKKDVPQTFRDYCMDRGNKVACPEDFGKMSVGWYLNHSKNPNAMHKDYNWYALRDIKEGVEILIDYNSLGEPENAKRAYYNT